MKNSIVSIYLIILLAGIAMPQSSKTLSLKTITGIVADSASNEKLIGVTVVALTGDNKKNPKGSISNIKGEFKIENVSENSSQLRFSLVGYKTKVIDVPAGNKTSAIDLGVVKLHPSSVLMKAVEVKGQKPMVEYFPDKQVVNMESVPGANGSVTDALKNTGIVDVDPQTNKISIRGKSGANILIDGKPMPMAEDMLTQMPAAMIDQVEITTNPSAKDDPEGDAGIINFITKKGYSDNYSGSFSAFTTSKGLGYGSAFVNMKKGSFNVYGSLNGGTGIFKSDLASDRINDNSSSIHEQQMTGDGLRKGYMSNAKIGADYDFDSLNSISLVATYYKMKGNGHNNSFTNVYNDSSLLRYNYSLLNYGELDNNTYNISGTYKKKFDKKGTELTSDIYFSHLDYTTPGDMKIAYSSPFIDFGPPVHQAITSVTGNKTVIAKLDFADPNSGIGKINAGYNFTFRDRSSDYNFEDYHYSSDLWVNNPAYTNFFRYKENIHALYADYGNKLLFFDYRLGARVEKILSTGTVVTTNQNFDLDYSSFFPSLLLAYNLTDRFQITFNATRRIRRPQMEYINPFKRINGPLDYNIGNPALQPTYTNQYELAFNPILKVYHSNSTGKPVSITALVGDTLFTSMVNNASTKAYGVEVMIPLMNDAKFPVKLPDWFTMGNINFNWSRTEEKSNYLTENYSLTRNSWFLGANAVLKVWYEISAIFMCRYTPEVKDIRTISNPKTYVSFTLAKDLMDKKLRLTFSVSDIFNASMSQTQTYASNYYLNSKYTNLNSQNVSFSITYKFNDFKSRQERSIDDGRDKTEGGLF